MGQGVRGGPDPPVVILIVAIFLHLGVTGTEQSRSVYRDGTSCVTARECSETQLSDCLPYSSSFFLWDVAWRSLFADVLR